MATGPPKRKRVWHVYGELLREGDQWLAEKSIPLTYSDAKTAADQWRARGVRNVRIDHDATRVDVVRETKR